MSERQLTIFVQTVRNENVKDVQEHSEQDQKVAAILSAAFEAFRSYGFRRTSMEDIAAGAGMSRSALYLHFRNKEDIYRSLATRYYDVHARAMESALPAGKPIREALTDALAERDGKVVEEILASPHGAELLDTGFATSSDIAQAGEARFAQILGDWVAAEADAGRIVLMPEFGSAQELATSFLMAAKGLKQPSVDPGTYRELRERHASVFAKALET